MCKKLITTISLFLALASVGVAAGNVGPSPDTRDAAAAAHAFGSLDPAIATAIAVHKQTSAPSDGRSPDTVDAALLAHLPQPTPVATTDFHWADFGVGFAAATGALLLLVGLNAAVRTTRRRFLAGHARSA